jgi:hypothetical protein
MDEFRMQTPAYTVAMNQVRVKPYWACAGLRVTHKNPKTRGSDCVLELRVSEQRSVSLSRLTETAESAWYWGVDIRSLGVLPAPNGGLYDGA